MINGIQKIIKKGESGVKKDHQRFYYCKHCGNLIGFIHNSGVPIICCGEEMTLLEANTTDASVEKHVPVIKVDGNKVTVEIGSTPHPMIEQHYIQWIYIQTEKGGQRKILTPNDPPRAEFMLTDDDKLEIAFEYCNLHGLWKADYEG
ncbi:MAG TPA: desulfoferrodoxin [Clostridia bacterium]|nr:desulfoferrodoxin [Clostridia bacterium]